MAQVDPKRHWATRWGGVACGVSGAKLPVTLVPAEVSCLVCLRSPYGPDGDSVRARREREWEAGRRRAKDRREAQRVVLERHREELDAELALRALAWW